MTCILDRELLLKELSNGLTTEEFMELSEDIRDEIGELVDERKD